MTIYSTKILLILNCLVFCPAIAMQNTDLDNKDKFLISFLINKDLYQNDHLKLENERLNLKNEQLQSENERLKDEYKRFIEFYCSLHSSHNEKLKTLEISNINLISENGQLKEENEQLKEQYQISQAYNTVLKEKNKRLTSNQMLNFPISSENTSNINDKKRRNAKSKTFWQFNSYNVEDFNVTNNESTNNSSFLPNTFSTPHPRTKNDKKRLNK